MLQRLTLIMCVLAISACSSNSRTPDEQAISYALVQDVIVRKLTDTCSDISVTAKQAAWRGYRSWWKRNGSLVEAADYGLSYNLITLTDNRQETGARLAMGLTFDIVNEAEQHVKELLAEGDKTETCLGTMAEYRDGNMDLREDSNMYPLLVKLQQQHDSKGQDLYIKMSEIEDKSHKKYSRSAFAVERLTKREGCVNPKVRTLKADGPNEVLEATCADNSFFLIRCEWRNCKIQD
ncbi:hypothetical protein NBRC116188_05240 [Oceaniserpentilla sp. 4NH20-0058]|uniref:hypothetical protein n=1 Tax=Oceaniserpentilla sp. 4NH20-0058 TaxID=3127660 RepID=UPI0031082944